MPASHSGKGFGNARTSAVKGQNRPSSCIASGIWCIFVYLCCKKCGNEIINVPKTKEDKKCILPSQNVRSRPLTILLWLSVLPDKKSCPEEEEAKYCILHWQQPQKTMMQYSQNTSWVFWVMGTTALMFSHRGTLTVTIMLTSTITIACLHLHINSSWISPGMFAEGWWKLFWEM